MGYKWDELIKDQRLPKADILKVSWHWWWFRHYFIKPLRGERFWLYSRTANAAVLYVGPIELVWRRPWLRGPAEAYYPQFFSREDRAD